MTGPGATHHDGDGWVECAQGHRHWGRFGAAGLLLHRGAADGDERGCCCSTEPSGAITAAPGACSAAPGTATSSPWRPPCARPVRRPACTPTPCAVSGLYDDDHGGWSYITVVAAEVGDAAARPTSAETVEVAWWPVEPAARAAPASGLRRDLAGAARSLEPLTVVVDAANVVGSRPDGWWKDRAGRGAAAGRRRGDRALLGRDPRRGRCRTTLAPPAAAALVALAHGRRRRRGTVAAEEASVTGAAAGYASWPHRARVTMRSSPRLPTRATGRGVVVTADRELRTRCEALGAVAVGPRWLLGLMDAAAAPYGLTTQARRPKSPSIAGLQVGTGRHRDRLTVDAPLAAISSASFSDSWWMRRTSSWSSWSSAPMPRARSHACTGGVHGHLPEVVARTGLAGGHRHRAVERAVGLERGAGSRARLAPGGLGVLAERVAGEPVPRLVDGAATEQVGRPALLVDDVRDQRPHVPVRARASARPTGRHATCSTRVPNS